MNIAKDRVIQFHYTLKDEAGAELESSRQGEPMAYLHGHGGIIPGLEEALEGKGAGESLSVTVPPEKGYGPRRDDMVQRVPLKHLQGAKRWRVGMIASVQTERGPRQVVIVKLGRFNADVDFNHPMAGRTLTFELDILDVREASTEELAHGHAHGVGGHQH
ncbi:FKBP-type peptidyl-prolyl cis-trans isomerase [Alkalilimnicola sp. S0819]|uniref:FKBP-type peptidyl-prolyl cis-trans isomerase n=1 Tax=Alkalilimnicola sp. S0819 TaxID=2613922 RepID=UPI0012629F27|nr:peptidylprolyl isomerase [Alkalilimnicola sp. S0819]KAB7627802.1 peptidylprolyl isomerase [Alkalilimnicola sp. S0819]MPQ15432.1 peptidylprolyl isomerase [Alkalilimnicola sp. S0819]